MACKARRSRHHKRVHRITSQRKQQHEIRSHHVTTARESTRNWLCTAVFTEHVSQGLIRAQLVRKSAMYMVLKLSNFCRCKKKEAETLLTPVLCRDQTQKRDTVFLIAYVQEQTEKCPSALVRRNGTTKVILLVLRTILFVLRTICQQITNNLLQRICLQDLLTVQLKSR